MTLIMSKMDRNYHNILKVNIVSTSIDKVLRFTQFSLSKKHKFYIVTPNPEQIVLAQKDKDFRKILNSADIAICDAIGTVQTSKFLGLKKVDNVYAKPILYLLQGLWVGLSTFFNKKWLESDLKVIKGRKLFMSLIQLANKKNWRVYFVGGEIAGTTQEAAFKLSSNYKSVKIKYSDGPLLDDNSKPGSLYDKKIENEVIEDINKFKPHLLFVGFGAPRQEKWVYRWLPKLNIGGAMVVGGTFDYVAGNVKLPPDWMSEYHLEWLWRLIVQPRRIMRIVNASVIFPLLVYKSKIKDS